MMSREFTFTVILIILAYSCVKSSPVRPTFDVTESSETTKPTDELVTVAHSQNSTVTIRSDNQVNSDKGNIENGDDHHYNTIYENYGFDDDAKEDDSEIFSDSVLSGIEKHSPETSMSLSDDVIIDALFTNIDTLQDQIELCEEGLRHKLLLISRKTLLNLENDGDDSYDDYDTLDEDYEQDKNNDTNSNLSNSTITNSNDTTARDTLNTRVKPTTDNDKKKGDDENNNVNLEGEENTLLDESSAVGTRQKRCVVSESDDSVHSTLADIVKNPGKAIVNRLSVRFEHLKNSLRECYVLYKSLK